MKQFNLSRRLIALLAAFGVTSIVMVIAFAVLLRESIDTYSTVANDATGKLSGNYQLLESLGKAHSDVQRFTRIKDPDEMDVALKEIAQHQETARKFINGTDVSSQSILNEKFAAFIAADKLVLDRVMHGNVASAYEQFFGPAAASQEKLLTELQRKNEAVVKTTVGTMAAHQAKAQKSVIWNIGILIVLLAGLMAFGWRLKNQIVTELSRISGTIADATTRLYNAAGQVSVSSETLANGASQQAASIEETSSSLEEMSSMTKRNAENAQKANELARQTRTSADRGVEDMQAMSSAMQTIKSSSDDIAKIIKTIDEIAFQTNILALNAAVEAARAGEAGMGFAVVADEVRNLAQRSAQAAKETAAKIESAISNTAQGVKLSGQVAATLNDIVAKARKMDELAAEVAGASREQTQGITQINASVGQVDKITQNNAACAEETASVVSELYAQVVTMKTSVAELMQLVGTQKIPSESIVASQGKSSLQEMSPARPEIKTHSATATKNGNSRLSQNVIPLESAFKDF